MRSSSNALWMRFGHAELDLRCLQVSAESVARAGQPSVGRSLVSCLQSAQDGLDHVATQLVDEQILFGGDA